MSRIELACRFSQGTFSLNVDLDLPAQGVNVIFGPSGSGKTTLLRCIAGLINFDGHLSVGGEVWHESVRGIRRPVQQRRLGYVFQDAALFDHLSVRGNLEYGWKRTAAGNRTVEFDHVVEAFALATLLDCRPSQLSGGECQRVAVARALLTSPRLLLMDEPLASLDVGRKREILPFLRRLPREFDVPLIYVSHSIGEVMQIGTWLALMRDGKVVESGGFRECFSSISGQSGAGQDAGAVLDATVADHEDEFKLTRLTVHGQDMFVPRRPEAIGERVRVFVPAGNVTLATAAPGEQTSALNILQGKVVDVKACSRDEQGVMVSLDVGDVMVARITRKSQARLKLRSGLEVYALIKAVSLGETWL